VSELPRPVLDALRTLGVCPPGHPTRDLTRGMGLVQALLDAQVLVLMDDHMEVIRDRDEWEAADEEACEALSRERAETARLRVALEAIGAQSETWQSAVAQAALEET